MKRRHHVFAPIRKAVVPFPHGGSARSAFDAAVALAAEVVVVGLVRLPAPAPLSSGAAAARELRTAMRGLPALESVRLKARVRVSRNSWKDLCDVVTEESPDLLILDTEALAALGLGAEEALRDPPCDVALVRGPFPAVRAQVLVPVRGGPYAELAVRLAAGVRAQDVSILHIRSPGAPESGLPYQPLASMLRSLPEIRTEILTSDDPASAILARARTSDVIILGSTAQPLESGTVIGRIPARILREFPGAVLAVKLRRPVAGTTPFAEAESHAVSIVVDKWFAENTFSADEFADLDRLMALKRRQDLTISLALPALNEGKTLGRVIGVLKRALQEDVPLLDEIVLIDSNSTDRTRTIAHRRGIPVFIHQEVLPRLGARSGKGEALWKSLFVTRGDIVAWIDTDIFNIHPRFVYGILGPLLQSPRIQFVKGFYRRPLRVGDIVQAGGGGRVTELTARPLLNLFYPELSGLVQPLSGEYAGRRKALEQCAFFSGYGVETGLLIDILEIFGLSAIAQTDLLERLHRNQGLDALGRMSFAIIQAVVARLERRWGRRVLEDANRAMKIIRHDASGYHLDVAEIAELGETPDGRGPGVLPKVQDRQAEIIRGMTDLILIRHAETVWNATGRWQGQIDEPLSERGMEQATLLASRLRTLPLDAIYASDLRRAVQTAGALAEGRGIPVRLERDLREVRLGEWEGLILEEIVARDPAAWSGHEKDPARFPPPGGETFGEVAGRMMRAVQAIAEAHEPGRVAVVSHGLSLAALRCVVTLRPVGHAREFVPPHVEPLILRTGSDRGWQIVPWVPSDPSISGPASESL